MAGSRTLKLSILGDVDNLNKSLKTATADVDTFGDKITKTGKVIGAAFVAAAAAAGAYAIKIGIDGVKAALDDEKAQRTLAKTLENTTGATNAQIAAVEQYITQTSLAVGVTDDQLRPAFSRLVRSTKDTEEAQKLLNLALDISSATGKPLEAIANSLGKAYDGNTNALGKLGLGIDQSILKTKDFNKVYESLRGSFAGFAEQEANTFQGRLDRLNVAFDEAKETIGFALLPVLEKVIRFINNNALPIINAFANAFSNKEGGLTSYVQTLGNILIQTFTPIINGLVKAFTYVKDAVGDNLETFKVFGSYIATYLAPVIGTVLGGALQVVGKIAGGVIDVIAGVIKVINGLIGGAIDGINALIRAYNAVPLLPNIPTISKPTLSSPSVTSGSSISGVLGGSIPSVPSVTVPNVTGGGSGGGVSAAATSAAKAAVSVATPYSTALTPSAAIRRAEMATAEPTINLTVNQGIVGDPEGAARSIVDVLNRSYGRGALGAEALFL
jgi:phage-related protein